MDEMKYVKLTEVQGRLEANMIESYFKAQGMEVEFFQESVGQSSYAMTVNGFGRVQVFVPKDKLEEARKLLKNLREGIPEEDEEN